MAAQGLSLGPRALGSAAAAAARSKCPGPRFLGTAISESGISFAPLLPFCLPFCLYTRETEGSRCTPSPRPSLSTWHRFTVSIQTPEAPKASSVPNLMLLPTLQGPKFPRVLHGGPWGAPRGLPGGLRAPRWPPARVGFASNEVYRQLREAATTIYSQTQTPQRSVLIRLLRPVD